MLKLIRGEGVMRVEVRRYLGSNLDSNVTVKGFTGGYGIWYCRILTSLWDCSREERVR
jgi:hypothetical protein